MKIILEENYPAFFSIISEFSEIVSTKIDSPEAEIFLNKIAYIKTKVELIYKKSKLILFPFLEENGENEKNRYLLKQLIDDLDKIFIKTTSFRNEVHQYSFLNAALDEMGVCLKKNIDNNKQLFSFYQ